MNHIRKCELCKALNEVIEASGATYGETVDALKWLLVAYQDKGSDLLNDVGIQKVAERKQKNSVLLPNDDDIERMRRDQASK